MAENRHNWAKNLEYAATRIHQPANVDEVQEIVANAEKVKALGSRHSFNSIADTPHDLVSLEKLNRIISIDREQLTVEVESGVTYGRLARHLQDEGFAVHNLASLPHISVAGACATATHGSGDGNGNLATTVAGMEIVKADGSRATISRETVGNQFDGMVVHLGALGVVTQLTLSIVPSFAVRQEVYEDLPMDELESKFERILGGAYSVSLFTNWEGSMINQVWMKNVVAEKTGEPQDLALGASKAPTHRHPIREVSPENCTEQMGIEGAWHERLPHFKMDFTPSNGEELQSEFLVPRENALAAVQAIHKLSPRISPLLLVSEIRTIAPDTLWMSPCYHQACIGIHFTWKQDWQAVKALLPTIEETLIPFGARPHWGKLFTMSGQQIATGFPKIDDFRKLVHEYDPHGKFRNEFLDLYVFA
jgi:xylitol oxidase